MKTIKQPVTKQPVTKQPVTKQPVTKQPVTKQPVTKQPVTKQPIEVNERQWHDIKGIAYVYCNFVNGRYKFSTSISRSNQDGDKERMFFDIRFKSDIAPEPFEGCMKIKINQGFLSFYTTQMGQARAYIVVTDYDEICEPAEVYEEDEEENEKLPF